MIDFTVYRITNKVNGKVYVGQTTMGLDRRWWCHVSIAKTETTPLARAIRKYGREAFTVEVLMECDDASSLDAAERFWIWRLKSQVPSGYNLTDGGNSGTVHSPETCAKKSASHLKRYEDPAQRAKQGDNARKHWARPEVKAKATASHAAYWTPEHRAEYAARSHRIPTPEERAAGHAAWRIKVIASKDGQEQRFPSSRDAAKALGVHESAISQCLAGKVRHAHGYTFRKEQ